MNNDNQTEKENEIRIEVKKLCVYCVVSACAQGRKILLIAFV
jgi:hypothetical protein